MIHQACVFGQYLDDFVHLHFVVVLLGVAAGVIVFCVEQFGVELLGILLLNEEDEKDKKPGRFEFSSRFKNIYLISMFDVLYDQAFSAGQAGSIAGLRFSDRNNPISVSRMPSAAVQVIFS